MLAVALAAACSCGRTGERRTTSLSFETLSDTASMTSGAPILTSFEPYRLPNGLVRARGTARLPDGTRLQISMLRASDRAVVTRLQVPVEAGRFD